MARTSWLDENATFQPLDDQVHQLEHFVAALADGIVEPHELAEQHERVRAAMATLEPKLTDELHTELTRLLAELTAYNIMNTLHELWAARSPK
ncbi:MAG: hypothetical protein HUU55_02045 [Myxococcales bacterium]|nr:hypothetical protein [Myxococcales bacterium]